MFPTLSVAVLVLKGRLPVLGIVDAREHTLLERARRLREN
jgi:hypothetical protein